MATIVAFDSLVQELEARGYRTRGGLEARRVLDRFLLDNGYPPSDVQQQSDRSFLFLGAAEGAVDLLLGSAWFGGTSEPPAGAAPADAPPVKPSTALAGIDPAQLRTIGAIGAIGVGGLILGVVIANAAKTGRKR